MNIGSIKLFPSFLAKPANPVETKKENKLERQPETDEFTKEINEALKKLPPDEALKAEKAKMEAEFQKNIKRPQKFSKENK